MSVSQKASIEMLESRRLLAGGPLVASAVIDASGTLVITGTKQADDIVVRREIDSGASTNQIVVLMTGAEQRFDSALITAGISVNLGKGNDTFSVDDTGGDVGPVGVDGGAGNDSISGGNGNDRLDGDQGKDTLNGDGGNDTLIGDKGNDSIIGGGGDDSINGSQGNDTIVGGGGNDIIAGAQGKDSIHGGDGDDVITGDQGNDTLFGDAGNDHLNGGQGKDVLSGGEGDDLLEGDNGNDSISGDAGNDDLYGGNGKDSLSGGDDDDDLLGGLGRDLIEGGAGSDSFSTTDDAPGEYVDLTGDDRRDTPVTADELPAEVLAAFNATYPGASIREIESEIEDVGLVYEIDFIDAGGTRNEVEYTADGTPRPDDDGDDVT